MPTCIQRVQELGRRLVSESTTLQRESKLSIIFPRCKIDQLYWINRDRWFGGRGLKKKSRKRSRGSEARKGCSSSHGTWPLPLISDTFLAQWKDRLRRALTRTWMRVRFVFRRSLTWRKAQFGPSAPPRTESNSIDFQHMRPKGKARYAPIPGPCAYRKMNFFCGFRDTR